MVTLKREGRYLLLSPTALSVVWHLSHVAGSGDTSKKKNVQGAQVRSQS